MNYKEKYIKYKKKYLNLKKIENPNYCKKVQKGGGTVSFCDLCGAPININGANIQLDDLFEKIDKLGEFNAEKGLLSQKKGVLISKKKLNKKIKDSGTDWLIEGKKKYLWMEDLLYLHWSGMILKVTPAERDDDWNHEFKDKFGKVHEITDIIIAHKDCYQVLKSKYGDFTYFNINWKNISWHYNNKNYGFIRKYFNQDYKWVQYFYDNVNYVLESPLKNARNKKRILNISKNFITKKINPLYIDFLSAYKKKNNKKINPTYIEFLSAYKNNKLPKRGFYKILPFESKKRPWDSSIIYTEEEIDFYLKYFFKTLNKSLNKSLTNKKKDRPSPSESATKFKVGRKKKGNDGNMWIIVENKNGVKRWSKSK